MRTGEIKEFIGEKYSLFYPKSKRSLLDEYPELREYPALKALNRSEILFVWYYACKASPYYNIDDHEKRVIRAMNKSFGKSMREQTRKEYLSGKMPEKILQGIQAMKVFEPAARIRAKQLFEKIIVNFEKLIDVDLENDPQFSVELGREAILNKKTYAQMCKEVTAKLPDLVRQAEQAFGLVEVSEEGKVSAAEVGSMWIDDYHKQSQ